MRRELAVLLLSGASLLAPASGATTPQFSVVNGSSVTLGVAGAKRTIVPQTVPLRGGSAVGTNLRSTSSLVLPRIDLAFGEFVDVFQHQEMVGQLTTGTGAMSVDFPLWVVDADGNRLELPTHLSTSTPTTRDCGNVLFCFGNASDPAYCKGTAWNPATGHVRLVGVTPIPFGSGTTVDCSAFVFVVEVDLTVGDSDTDGVLDVIDRCPNQSNPTQLDTDADGLGDVCDNCPSAFNPHQNDGDGNGVGNACQPLKINFQPNAAPVPAGWVKDTGQPFNAGTGKGWLGATLQTRDRNILADQLLDTLVFTAPQQRWEAVLPPGSYDLSLAIGDAQFAQGPQRLISEDLSVFDGVSTAAQQFLFADIDSLPVTDGRLSVAIGGAGGTTVWNYVQATEVGAPFFSRAYNFQPAASPQPLGFTKDTGAIYDALAGRGWDVAIGSRDRAILADPVKDTHVFTTDAPATWEVVLPADYYELSLAIGDALYAQGPQTVIVEDEVWAEGVSTAAGEISTLSGRVLVLDGALTVTIGEPGGTTALVYVTLASANRDLDGDGITNFNDNCFEHPNPAQEDADGDGVGNACNVDADGDEWGDLVDNCPGTHNPAQGDGDGDHSGDVCDCAPANGGAFDSVSDVTGLDLGGAPYSLSWDSQAFDAGPGTVYDIVSISLQELWAEGSFDGATCVADDRTSASWTDTRPLPASAGYAYLVRAENACGVGSYGADSAAGIALDASGPCP